RLLAERLVPEPSQKWMQAVSYSHPTARGVMAWTVVAANVPRTSRKDAKDYDCPTMDLSALSKTEYQELGCQRSVLLEQPKSQPSPDTFECCKAFTILRQFAEILSRERRFFSVKPSVPIAIWSQAKVASSEAIFPLTRERTVLTKSTRQSRIRLFR